MNSVIIQSWWTKLPKEKQAPTLIHNILIYQTHLKHTPKHSTHPYPIVKPWEGFFVSFGNTSAWFELWLLRHPLQRWLSLRNTWLVTQLDKEPGHRPQGSFFVLEIFVDFNNWSFGPLFFFFSSHTVNSHSYILNSPIKNELWNPKPLSSSPIKTQPRIPSLSPLPMTCVAPGVLYNVQIL